MSSPYVKLGNRTPDQLKVAELREELKRRNLATKGLKEELVKRLDEAVRSECENGEGDAENDVNDAENDVNDAEDDENDANPSELPLEQTNSDTEVCEGSMDLKAESNPQYQMDDNGSLFEGKVEVSLEQGTKATAVENTVRISETVETVAIVSEEKLQNDSIDDVNAEPSDTKVHLPMIKDQVPEVDTDFGFQVKSDSVSTESVSITEKVELKVDVITDNVPLESSNAIPDGGQLHPLDVEEPLDEKETEEPCDKKDVNEKLEKRDVKGPLVENVSVETTGGSNDEMVDSLKNIDMDDLVNEKLNLDRSSGDDSMEEDIVESKIDENALKSGRSALKEKDNVDVISHDKPAKTMPDKAENEAVSTVSGKRKCHDIPETALVGNNDPAKKARRWNAEGLISPGTQGGTKVFSVTPKGLAEPAFKRSSEADPKINEGPKERLVPPSSRAPSNSLRIDHFLRPFTLKQVQELLGKTGNVTGFWMDHIKTHCYVSFSSVEEAVGTRNAVYNLRWPPNGGRQLVAEFADPQEIKARVEAAAPPAATPSAAMPPQNSAPAQPSPRQQVPRHHQLPPPPPPPPPPLANPAVEQRLHREALPSREHSIQARERLNNHLPLPPPPPPPPLVEMAEPPLVTLDDLFWKTKATPKIYYLPLSDEEVAGKTKEQGKNVVN